MTFDEFVERTGYDRPERDDTITGGLTLDGFKLALVELDRELTEPLNLRAVGGFALMCRDLRKTMPVTVDIDTVTPDPAPAQQAAIERVAARLHLPGDWINNSTVFAPGDATTQEDCDAMDVMLDADYEPARLVMDPSQDPSIDAEFAAMRHISLDIATLETLAHAKAYAVLSIGCGRTGKDALDFIEISREMGIDTLAEAYKRLPWLNDFEFEGFGEALTADLCDADGYVDTEPATGPAAPTPVRAIGEPDRILSL